MLSSVPALSLLAFSDTLKRQLPPNLFHGTVTAVSNKVNVICDRWVVSESHQLHLAYNPCLRDRQSWCMFPALVPSRKNCKGKHMVSVRWAP